MTRILFAVAIATLGAMGCAQTRSERTGDRYYNAVDPCWPDRYNHTARLTTLQPFQAQAANGQVLVNTVWNYHFDTGKDTLNQAGKATLNMIAQQRPSPNPNVFIQTSRDGIAFDNAAPEKFADAQRDLNERRMKAVQEYLAAQTALRPVNWSIQAIDPSDPAVTSRYGVQAVQSLTGAYTGRLSGGGGGSGGSVSGNNSGGGGGISQ